VAGAEDGDDRKIWGQVAENEHLRYVLAFYGDWQGAVGEVLMNTAIELEQWLRKEAKERTKYAESRKGYARTPVSDAERKAAHQLAQKMMGRKFPLQSREEEEKSHKIEERIAEKLEQEAEMLLRFADFVASGEVGDGRELRA
jgi:hypothetical protein